jgi:hypothetical protein
MISRSRQKPVIGKYTLDSISIGMYNNPLMLFREYIQNSVDAIDEAVNQRELSISAAAINIKVDGKARSITITDNGVGIPIAAAWERLNNIGRSLKKAQHNRGFRGIGRLGGLGYCDKLIFTTKTTGERMYSINTWDCKKLRMLLSEDNHELNVVDIISLISEIEQHAYEGSSQHHFFHVRMEEVKSPRDVLLNVPIIKSYLSQVAPVPFDHKIFTYADELDKQLRLRVPKYETYIVKVNEELVFKPYSNAVPIGQDCFDTIQGVEFQELDNHTAPLAFGWLAKTNHKGIVNQNSFMEGIRVRSGNIQVGDKDLLAGFFRERRFNNYVVGELHIINPNILPNSRRDDFEDTQFKEELYDSFVQKLGLPLSKEIRKLSTERGLNARLLSQNLLIENARSIIENGYLSESQKKAVAKNIVSLRMAENDCQKLVKEIETSKHYLDKKNGNITPQKKILYGTIFDIIFASAHSHNEAEKIVKRIIEELL